MMRREPRRISDGRFSLPDCGFACLFTMRHGIADALFEGMRRGSCVSFCWKTIRSVSGCDWPGTGFFRMGGNKTLMQIENLSVTLTRDGRVLLDNLNLTLTAGDRLAIIGEEGNGKSTLLRLLCSDELVSGYAGYTGRIMRGGHVGYLPQELPPGERTQTVYEWIGGSEAFLGAPPRELEALTAAWRLPSGFFYSDQTVGSLSGGERIKLQLARLRLERPDVLLLDEPSNDLDIDGLRLLETFLLEARCPVLYVSHDETLIERTATVILHLEQLEDKTKARHTIARVPYDEYVRRRADGLSRQERLSRKDREEYERQQARWRAIYERVDREQRTISRADPHGGQLLKKKMKAVQSQKKRFEQEKDELTPMPETEEAIFLRFGEAASLPNGKGVLDWRLDRLEAGGQILARDVRLSITGPAHICLTGPNGCGKSTLLRLLAAELLPRRDIRAAYMPQQYEEQLDMAATPVEWLAPEGDRAAITLACTRLGSCRFTAEEMQRPIAALSGGQKAKLMLLRMVLQGSNVLILDEPTRNFSPLSGPVIRGILREFRGAILSVSHDRRFIREVCDRVYVLSADGLHESSLEAVAGEERA